MYVTKKKKEKKHNCQTCLLLVFDVCMFHFVIAILFLWKITKFNISVGHVVVVAVDCYFHLFLQFENNYDHCDTFFLFFISCTSLTYVRMPIISTAKLHLVCLFLVFPSVVIWRRRKKKKKKKRKGGKCRSWRLEKVCVKQNHYDIFCTVAKVNINTC